LNQPGYRDRRPVDNSAIPNVIFALLVANGLVFALQQFQFEFMLKNFALWPINIPPELLSQIAPESRPSFMPWQLVTYGFLHSTDYLGHIFFNMFGLWMFGRDLERLMGPQRFLIYYMTCVIGAGLIQLIVVGRPVRHTPCLRHGVPESHRDAAVPADTDESEGVRDRVRAARIVPRRQRLCAGHRPLRASRWYAFRLSFIASLVAATELMISTCRLCGSSKLRAWMKDGRNRDLVYYRCDDCSLWNYDLDCGVDQTQYSEVYISPRDEAHRSNRLNVDSWKFLQQYVDSPRSVMDIGCGNAGFCSTTTRKAASTMSSRCATCWNICRIRSSQCARSAPC
jgi:hypothetical protein